MRVCIKLGPEMGRRWIPVQRRKIINRRREPQGKLLWRDLADARQFLIKGSAIAGRDILLAACKDARLSLGLRFTAYRSNHSYDAAIPKPSHHLGISAPRQTKDTPCEGSSSGGEVLDISNSAPFSEQSAHSAIGNGTR